MLPEKLAIIDVETSGAGVTRDRIIEIGLIRVEQGKVVTTFQSLINPQTYVSPFIENYTGITRSELDSAPTFDALASEIKHLLRDCTFVAHNARFDHAFLKNEFSRLDLPFSSKQLCTVKLSKALFPKERHHNLSAIISRFNIACPNRHRAFDDAHVVWDFLQLVEQQFPEEVLSSVLERILRKPSLPANLPFEATADLPEAPGVYIFYGDNDYPLYIGKSKNIKDRVLSHFSGDYTSSKEMHISQQIRRIDTIVTPGELSALLKESQLVKEMQPLYNRKLRHARQVILAYQTKTDAGYDTITLQAADSTQGIEVDGLLSIFKSQKQAKDYLTAVAKESQLCHKLLGLEKATGACFPHQLGWCKGACVGKELPIRYNLRFAMAFAGTAIKPWPYKGPIIITEPADDQAQNTGYLVDKWCLLGKIDEYESSVTPVLYPFDLDTYKILSQFILNTANQQYIRTTVQSSDKR